MEQYDELSSSQKIITDSFEKSQVFYSKAKDWFTTFLGIIITIVGAVVVFFISAIEGDFEIGLVLRSAKFWVLTLLCVAISFYVAYINYESTIAQMTNTKLFKSTLQMYSEIKKNVVAYTQYLPLFCDIKNKQLYEETKRDIVESADIAYEYYTSKDFDASRLQKWQIKRLKKIKRIKIVKLKPSDLLQESDTVSNKVRALPQTKTSGEAKFLAQNTLIKLLTSFLGGFLAFTGIALGNWVLGLTYVFMILSSSCSAVVSATTFANGTLRNRYIAKANYLSEFDNIKETFIKEV